MGKIAHVDLDRLRAVADTFWGVAADVATVQWPGLGAEELPGSDVGALRTRDLLAGQIADVIASLDRWAMAARASAEAFQHADTVNGERFTPR